MSFYASQKNQSQQYPFQLIFFLYFIKSGRILQPLTDLVYTDYVSDTCGILPMNMLY